MNVITQKISAEKIRSLFLFLLFFSIPFSIAGDDFSIIGLYFVTLYLFIKKREKWEHSSIVFGMGILLIGAFFSSIFSDDPLAGFAYFRNFWRFGLPFLIFFSLKNRNFKPYLNVALAVSCLVGIYAFAQYFTGIDYFRSETLQQQYRSIGGVWYTVGLFSHHLTYGGVSLMLFSVFAPLVLDSSYSPRQRIFWAFGSVVNLSAVVTSMGRSNWLGAMAAIGIMIVFLIGRKKLIVLAVFVVLSVSALWIHQSKFKDSSFYSTAIGHRISIMFSLEANKDRLMMWKSGIEIVKDNPWLGLGPNSGDAMLPYYQETARKHDHTFHHPPRVGVHNIYLQNWINFGFIGLAGYLIWWVTLLFGIITVIVREPGIKTGENALLLGSLAGLTGIMVAGFFENNFRDGEVQTAIFVVMGMALALLHKKRMLSRPLERS
ncbi:MAG: O-antigen ligase family protein [Proteobacteria bacterium]|nr:O-antigen ligase family protein [Pseudomonadota bacterium]